MEPKVATAGLKPPPLHEPPPPVTRVDRLPCVLIEDLATRVDDLRAAVPARSGTGAIRYREAIPPVGVTMPAYRIWRDGGAEEVPATKRPRRHAGLGCFSVDGATVFGRSHVSLPDGRVLLSTTASCIDPRILEHLQDPSVPSPDSTGMVWSAARPEQLIPTTFGAELLHLDFVYAAVFGHVLVDMLPKLALAQRLGLDDLPIPFPFAMPAFAVQIMSLFGLQERNIRYFNHRRRKVVADRIFMPSRAMQDGLLHPWLGEVAETYRERVLAGSRGGGPKRVYLSRRKWEERTRLPTLANRDQVAALLAGHGFVEIQPEEYSFADQVRLIADAEAVCAEDGSAVHSSLFAPRGLPLILLRRPNRELWFHAGIAGLCDQQLEVVDGLPLPLRGLNRGDDRPYLLPLEPLRAVLAEEFAV